ncbi:hypothetical protein H0H81_006978 [Sphagnurus paluster]|uniref:Uncharacterized protein n=1 Tax=Sphagnurus paluster TaxID=117069 RepID=A0A9P7GRX1_9AGAR|nr:hypothetical protein H0H81_006978 [Sphagnurus paluster]
MKDRRVSTISIDNNTHYELVLSQLKAVDGHFLERPPATIRPRGRESIRMQANTGSVGKVVYAVSYRESYNNVERSGKITLEWCCPFVGFNTVATNSEVNDLRISSSNFSSTGDLSGKIIYDTKPKCDLANFSEQSLFSSILTEVALLTSQIAIASDRTIA